MTNIKVLNLYAGIGGNRKLWDNCEVTAVEMDNEIANEYKRFFPDDEVVVGDAHNYLEKNYDKIVPQIAEFLFNLIKDKL